MEHIDFSKPGGYPFTQDTLNYLQGAYLKALVALASARGVGPYVLTGCVYTYNSGVAGYYLTAGWIFYSGELYYTPGGLVLASALSGSIVPGLTVVSTPTNLTFNDLSVNPVLINNTLAYGVVANSTDTGTRFPMSLLQPWSKGDVFTLAPGGSGSPTGSINYRKNYNANTLRVYGTINLTNAHGVSATATGSGPVYYQVQTLPAGFVPAQTVPFTLYYRYHDAPLSDDLGNYITTINGEVDNTGSINVGWRKSASGTAAYSVSFDFTIPLD